MSMYVYAQCTVVYVYTRAPYMLILNASLLGAWESVVYFTPLDVS